MDDINDFLNFCKMSKEKNFNRVNLFCLLKNNYLIKYILGNISYDKGDTEIFVTDDIIYSLFLNIYNFINDFVLVFTEKNDKYIFGSWGTIKLDGNAFKKINKTSLQFKSNLKNNLEKFISENIEKNEISYNSLKNGKYEFNIRIIPLNIENNNKTIDCSVQLDSCDEISNKSLIKITNLVTNDTDEREIMFYNSTTEKYYNKSKIKISDLKAINWKEDSTFKIISDLINSFTILLSGKNIKKSLRCINVFFKKVVECRKFNKSEMIKNLNSFFYILSKIVNLLMKFIPSTPNSCLLSLNYIINSYLEQLGLRFNLFNFKCDHENYGKKELVNKKFRRNCNYYVIYNILNNFVSFLKPIINLFRKIFFSIIKNSNEIKVIKKQRKPMFKSILDIFNEELELYKSNCIKCLENNSQASKKKYWSESKKVCLNHLDILQGAVTKDPKLCRKAYSKRVVGCTPNIEFPPSKNIPKEADNLYDLIFTNINIANILGNFNISKNIPTIYLKFILNKLFLSSYNEIGIPIPSLYWIYGILNDVNLDTIEMDGNLDDENKISEIIKNLLPNHKNNQNFTNIIGLNSYFYKDNLDVKAYKKKIHSSYEYILNCGIKEFVYMCGDDTKLFHFYINKFIDAAIYKITIFIKPYISLASQKNFLDALNNFTHTFYNKKSILWNDFNKYLQIIFESLLNMYEGLFRSCKHYFNSANDQIINYKIFLNILIDRNTSSKSKKIDNLVANILIIIFFKLETYLQKSKVLNDLEKKLHINFRSNTYLINFINELKEKFPILYSQKDSLFETFNFSKTEEAEEEISTGYFGNYFKKATSYGKSLGKSVLNYGLSLSGYDVIFEKLIENFKMDKRSWETLLKNTNTLKKLNEENSILELHGSNIGCLKSTTKFNLSGGGIYKNIYCPVENKLYSITSKQGKKILKKYILAYMKKNY